MSDSRDSESETKEVPFGHWAYDPQTQADGASLEARTLGPYQVGALISRGAMSEVYRARDTRDGRELALKVLRAHLAKHPLALARMEREAKAMAALSHPNILAIEDSGVEEDIAYEAMELLEGETLRARLRRSPLRWEQAVPIAIAIAEGLEAAHRNGIIHRDLKPENIFLTKEGGPKILDFGIARIKSSLPRAGPAGPQNMMRTTPGTVLGTVGYMSPEQARGEAAEPTSDIFSFGCVLYEMIAARRPFSKATEAETLASMFTDEPSSLRHSDEEMPSALDQIVGRCLQKDAGRRFQSAAELSRALSSVLFKPSVKQSTVSLAVLPLRNRTEDPSLEYLCEGISESVARELSRNPNLRTLAFSTTSGCGLENDDLSGLGRELGVKALISGTVREQGGELEVELRLHDGSDGAGLWAKRYRRTPADLLSFQSECVGQISSVLQAPLSQQELDTLTRQCSASGEAYCLYLSGRELLKRGEASDLRGSLDQFHRALDQDGNFALAYSGLADAYYALSQCTLQPREAVPQAKAASLRALELQPDVFEAHALLGVIRSQDEWAWPEAELALRRSLELNPHCANTRLRYGVFLVQSARPNEARLELDWAQRLDPFSVSAAVAAILPLVMTAPSRRQHQSAIDRLKRICALSPQSSDAVHLLSICYGDQQRYDEAASALVNALTLFPDDPQLLSRLGNIYARAGDSAGVQWILSRLAERAALQRIGPVHTALVHAGLGDRDSTFDYLERAYQERDRMLSMLQVDPAWDESQSDTRFRDLLQRVGLQPNP